jgi:hypothetical protein
MLKSDVISLNSALDMIKYLNLAIKFALFVFII